MPKKSDAAAKASTKANMPAFTKEEELHAYKEMLLIRRFEEKAGQMYGMGLIGGFCHLYIGQEAVVTGITMASKKGDASITGYRDHGHMLVVGLDPKAVMAELTGRKGGLSKGKGGSMHMFSEEERFYGGNGIVGAQVSLGTGLAFAAQYRGEDTVSLTYFGDGAANQARFMRALIWRSFGNCRLFTSLRTTNMRWARALNVRRPRLTCRNAVHHSIFRASKLMAWMCVWCATPLNARSRMPAKARAPISLRC